MVLALLFVARTGVGLQFQSIASTGHLLTADFGFGLAALGWLIGLYLIAGIVFAIPGGVLADRYGTKNCLLAGLALMVAGGLICGSSTSTTLLFTGRIVSGVGAVLLNVIMSKVVVDWFAKREEATAMAILVSSWPLGIGIGLFAFGDFSTRFGWHGAMYLAAAFSAFSLLAVMVLYREKSGLERWQSNSVLDLSRSEWTISLAGGLLWGAYNVGFIVLVSYTPILAQELGGGSVVEATRQLSWLSWSLLITVPIGGILADRLGRPWLLIFSAFLLIAVALTLLTMPGYVNAGYYLVIACAGLPAGAIMAMPAAVVRPQYRALAMGVFFTCFYCLMATLPGLAGLAGDITDTERAPLIFAACVLVAAALGVFGYLRLRPASEPAIVH